MKPRPKGGVLLLTPYNKPISPLGQGAHPPQSTTSLIHPTGPTTRNIKPIMMSMKAQITAAAGTGGVGPPARSIENIFTIPIMRITNRIVPAIASAMTPFCFLLNCLMLSLSCYHITITLILRMKVYNGIFDMSMLSTRPPTHFYTSSIFHYQ